MATEVLLHYHRVMTNSDSGDRGTVAALESAKDSKKIKNASKKHLHNPTK